MDHQWQRGSHNWGLGYSLMIRRANRQNSKPPQSQDAVLGGQFAAPPVQGIVLGGLAGVKQRFSSPHVEQRLAALPEALRHGQAGLELVVGALGDRAQPVQSAAYALLKDMDHPMVVDAVRQFALTSVKSRLNSYSEATQRQAMTEALALGHDGLDLVLQMLPTAPDSLQREAYAQLRDRPEPRVKKVLEFFSSDGLSYLRLREYLMAKQWQAADQETLRLLMRASRVSRTDQLQPNKIAELPCRDLQMIDGLWLQASRGRFGFSVQREVWMPYYDLFWRKADTWAAVGDRLGWRINHLFNPNHWRRQDEIIFDLRAPRGHLPFLGNTFGIFTIEAFAQRLNACDRLYPPPSSPPVT
jgi:hypothetical protein